MKTIRYAFVRSLPIMAGYIVLGLGFGVLLQSKSYGAGWAPVSYTHLTLPTTERV